LTGNYKPKIPGDDTGAWERLHLIPFKSYVPPQNRKKHLREQILKQEHEGILAWCVKGCLYLQNAGSLTKPGCVNDEVDIYRNEMDTVGQWLDECCEVVIGGRTPSSQLYNSYKAFCESIDATWMSQTAFGKDLENRGFTKYRVGQERGREGLLLTKNSEEVTGLTSMTGFLRKPHESNTIEKLLEKPVIPDIQSQQPVTVERDGLMTGLCNPSHDPNYPDQPCWICELDDWQLDENMNYICPNGHPWCKVRQ
jgi:putative DNA primase/helicase